MDAIIEKQGLTCIQLHSGSCISAILYTKHTITINFQVITFENGKCLESCVHPHIGSFSKMVIYIDIQTLNSKPDIFVPYSTIHYMKISLFFLYWSILLKKNSNYSWMLIFPSHRSLRYTITTLKSTDNIYIIVHVWKQI